MTRPQYLLVGVIVVLMTACNERAAAAYESRRTLVVPPTYVRASTMRSTQRMTYGFNGVPWLWQVASPWGSLPYGDNPECSTFAEGGCGPTAIAMVLKHYGWDVDPIAIGALAVSTGARSCPGGTDGANPNFLRVLEEHFSASAVPVHRDHDHILALLRARQPVIAIGKSRGYTAQHQVRRYGGHFLVLTGVDVLRHHGTRRTIVRVNDPGNKPKDGITYLTMPQFRRMHRFIHLRPSSSATTLATLAAGDDYTNVAAGGGGCASSGTPRSWGSRRGSRQLGEREWMAYGRELASCGPSDRPWVVLGLVGGRQAFIDAYVIPFLNGDVIRGTPFQRHASEEHAAICQMWGIEW